MRSLSPTACLPKPLMVALIGCVRCPVMILVLYVLFCIHWSWQFFSTPLYLAGASQLTTNDVDFISDKCVIRGRSGTGSKFQVMLYVKQRKLQVINEFHRSSERCSSFYLGLLEAKTAEKYNLIQFVWSIKFQHE